MINRWFIDEANPDEYKGFSGSDGSQLGIYC